MYVNKIKKYLHKNITNKKIEFIEDELKNIVEDVKINTIKDYKSKMEKNIEKYEKEKNENIQLRLDNLNLHKEIKKNQDILQKMAKKIENLNKDNETLANYIEELEKQIKINSKNTAGIWVEE